MQILFLSLLPVAATWFSNIRSTKIDRQNKEYKIRLIDRQINFMRDLVYIYIYYIYIYIKCKKTYV